MQEQIYDAIKNAAAKLPKGMKINTMGMDDIDKQAEDDDDEDDPFADDEENERKHELPEGKKGEKEAETC